MADITINFKLTPASFDEVFSIDDWINFAELTNKEMYSYMVNFVVDAEGKPISIEEARKLFKSIKKSEWIECLTAFTKAVGEAFVNPTSGGS